MAQAQRTSFMEPARGRRSRRAAAFAALFFTLHVSTATFAEAPQSAPVASLKSVSYQDKVLRIRLDHPVSYRIFSLDKPQRLVVELSHTAHGDKPYEAPMQDDVLKKIRFAQFQDTPEKIARVVLEITHQVPFEASQDGNDILLRFGAKKDKTETAAAPASVPAPSPALSASLSGKAEESVESSAASTSMSSLKALHSKDLLASLPKNPVTIDFDDAEISDVLRVLSEMSNINIIHASTVRGTVSVHLDQVPFNEAFDTILTMQGLVAQQMGTNILRILTPEDLNSDRSRAVVTVKTFILNYAKASEIMPLLATVKISPNAKVLVNDRTNSLVVSDTPEGIAAAERLINDLDTRTQQVLIEAKIVEVSLNNSMDLGIEWNYNTSHTDSKGATTSFTPSVSLPNTAPASSAITFGFINNTNNLTATLNALATEGKTKVLSSPRIITLNNQEAKIQVGSKIPFNTVTVAAGGGSSTQSVIFVDVGIILTVTPTINADNRIRVHLKPEVSTPGATTLSAGPSIDTRNAETEVIIRDGETLVVGGLIDERTQQSISKIPLLGDIPVLGAFFRSSLDTKNRTELLIFVTPRIVRD